jgi:hypothetical protein
MARLPQEWYTGVASHSTQLARYHSPCLVRLDPIGMTRPLAMDCYRDREITTQWRPTVGLDSQILSCTDY